MFLSATVVPVNSFAADAESSRSDCVAVEEPLENDILHAPIRLHVVDALKIAGANVTTNPVDFEVDFEPYVTEDRELITGQNPRSDHLISKKCWSARPFPPKFDTSHCRAWYENGLRPAWEQQSKKG